MKTLSVLLLTILCLTVNAKDYYISNSGNDSNSGTDISSPWQTLNKLNAFKNFVAGDNIFFKRGDVFYGNITISKSGTSINPITFGAYGTGKNPVITGFTTVSSWTNLGGNIWQSSSIVSSLKTSNVVSIAGINTPMGRYPNSEYLVYQNYSGNTSITSSSINGPLNWTGAEVVIKKKYWIIDRATITSQSGGTITYTAASSYTGSKDWGFFIQNNARTLDQQNEWYYDGSSKKISVYSTSEPVDVKVSSIDYLVSANYYNYITFENISFVGANKSALFLGSCSNITIKNCTISFCTNGVSGANMGLPSSYFDFENNSMNHIQNNGLYLTSEFHYATIKNNEIRNVGLIDGMGDSGDGTYYAIFANGKGSLIESNILDTLGYIGIGFDGDSVTVNKNFVNYYGLIKDDGGGIYTSNDRSGKVISNNIVTNGIGNTTGSPYPSGSQTNGIYLDDYSSGVNVFNNSVANVGWAGYFLHNAKNINLRNNTSYNAGWVGMVIQNEKSSFKMSDITIKNNSFVAKESTQRAARFMSMHNDLSTFGIIDSNYYARPIKDDQTINVLPTGNSGTEYNYTLAQWQNFSNKDRYSKRSPKAVRNSEDLRFEYNSTSSNKTIPLDAEYIDALEKSHNGIITLPPYSSIILIRNGELKGTQPPTANAGNDKTITLPTNTVTLSGSGMDSDGTIKSYAWKKVSGPSAYNVKNPTSANTDVTGMTQGAYQFELTVTDNKGDSGKDTIQITVNEAPNKLPTANAGKDNIVTLPISSVTLLGSGSDSDGTIKSYAWKKVSGPSAYNIVSPASSTTNVTSMTQGIYQFELTVTDNRGGTDKATVQVTVNEAPNKLPTANAGKDNIVTLPISSVTLLGSGSDSDGTIKSYAWKKVSGPSAYNIVSPASSTTSVTGMTQGIYQFELTVTDNRGGTDKATVQITVNEAPNKLPTANAGKDNIVTLPVSSVTLSGSGSDSDGTIKSYAWKKVSGPSAYNIASPASSTTNVTGMTQGIYQFELTVTDNRGGTDKATVQVTVNEAPNKLPTANAGKDNIVTLPISTVTLSGSGSDSDGTIRSYAWKKVSGPSAYNIVSPASSTTNVTSMTQGIYQFELTVTDNRGGTDKATVQVTVNEAPNKLPTANAGKDNIVTLPISTVTLSGSGSDSDGTIRSYAWKKVSGPSAYNIVSPASSTTNVTSMTQGIYQFELTVTDNRGGTDKATVQVTVNEAPNKLPTANAGKDNIVTLPISSITLSGSGSDSDGTIRSYAWKKVSGPSAYNMVTPSSSNTEVTGLVEGVYQFELTVTDDRGGTGKGLVQVTVNEAPKKAPSANAGGDKIITLPDNSISLIGSGGSADGTFITDGMLLPAVNPSSTINGINYKYYEADRYTSVPSFKGLTPVKSGTVNNFDITPASRSTAFSFSFTGYINIPADGQYTFYTTSDDGSKLYIDDVLVVENDALQTATEKHGVIGLKAGKHAISVGYFQQNGSKILEVSYSSQKIAKQKIPASALFSVSASSLLLAVNPSQTVNGLDYNYYEAGSYSSVPSFEGLNPVKTGTVSNFDISAANRATVFSFNFKGYIDVPADGQYTFYTTSDDGSKLYIDDVLVVNNDALQNATEKSGTVGLKAGKHAISVGYFQRNGDKVLEVSYSSQKIAKQKIPASALYRESASSLVPAVNPSNTTNGLDYKYYESESYNAIPLFNELTPVKKGTSSNFDISIGSRNNSFSLSFTGFIDVPADGLYTFYTTSDDGSNLYIDNKLIVDNDGLHGAAERYGVIGLKAGKHAISVGYFQQGWDKTLSVSYQGPGVKKQEIPASALYRASLNGLLPALNPSNTVNGLNYGYYEASAYNSVPSFTGLTPVKTGIANGFDVSLANRKSVFSFNFTGYINVPVDGLYTFYTTSDDGSNLYIDNIQVVNNDSLHSARERSGVIGLQAGKHAISVQYFQQEWDNILLVSYAGPVTTKQIIPSTSLYRVQNSQFQRSVNTLISGIGVEEDDDASKNEVGLKNIDKSDDTIRSYVWKQISGPNSSIITQNNSAAVTAGNLIQGVYRFELTVTDNKGGTGKDTVKVTVNEAANQVPLASARNDKSITDNKETETKDTRKVKAEAGKWARETNTFNVYPNPVHDIATVDIKMQKHNTNLMIVISDMSGKVVYKKNFVSAITNIKNEVNMSNLIKGTYIITVFFDGTEKQSVKVIKL